MLKKVLIVDDELAIHSSLDYVLRKNHIEVLHAINGKEALAQLQLQKPDLILMDFKLDGPNGIVVTQRIKALPGYKDIPIVGITAYASEENIQVARQNGIAAVIEKPFDLIELQKVINSLLEK